MEDNNRPADAIQKHASRILRVVSGIVVAIMVVLMIVALPWLACSQQSDSLP